MTWKPDLSTREEVDSFLQDLLAVLPDQLGIDEVIAGCEVLVIPAGALPKYIYVALGGDAGPPQTGYTQAVLYRGGITGLAVGDYVTVIHLREGNRYEVLGPGGATGVVPDPAPVDAQYVTMALDATLTDERVLTAGDGIDLVDGGAGGNATLSVDCSDLLGAWIGENATNDLRFQPDSPIVVSAGGVIVEYATIQLAITAAASCETVLVPPGTYAEDITLKNGVCVKGFGPRDKIRITGDVSIVTTASGGWLENVTIVMTDPPFAGASSAVHVVHNGTCYIRQVTIIGTQSAANPIRGIGGTGAGTGTLVADDIIIDISSAGNQAAYGVHLNLGSYGLEMKNFKIMVDNSNGGAAAWALGIVQVGSCTIEATEGWLDVTVTGAGTAVDLSGTITYSEIVTTDEYTVFGQRLGVGTSTPITSIHTYLLSGSCYIKIESDDGAAGMIMDRSAADKYCVTYFQTAGANNWLFGLPDSDIAGDGSEFFIGTTAAAAQFWMETDGKIGIGTITPFVGWNIPGVPGIEICGTAPALGLDDSAGGDRYLLSADSASNFYIYNDTNMTIDFLITGAGVVRVPNLGGGGNQDVGADNAGNLYVPFVSDIKLKSNIEPLGGGLDVILALRGVTFDWNLEALSAVGLDFRGCGRQAGLIAQEVKKVLPIAALDGKQYESYNRGMIMPYIIEAVKEIASRIEQLEVKLGVG